MLRRAHPPRPNDLGVIYERDPWWRRLAQLRLISLPRANLLMALSLGLALILAHPPALHASLWLVVPMLLAMWGSAETARCMRRSWTWYHGGVLLLLYADLMISVLIVFLLVYPYALRLDRVP